MASRALEPDRPTFYLDHSTLVDAFRVASAEHVELFHWIERIATNANLCLSLFHLAELSDWRDVAAANGMADWLDQLPIVWVDSVTRVEEAEARYWVLVAAGMRPPTPVRPFAGSLLAAMHQPGVDVLATTSRIGNQIRAFLDAWRVVGTERERTLAIRMARGLRRDRNQVRSAGWSDLKKEERLEYMRRCDLRRRAAMVDEQLRASGDAEYLARTSSTVEHIQDGFANCVAKEPEAMPSWRIANAFTEGFANVAAGRQTGSKRERKLGSSSFDFLHAVVGAAYCDVFTCGGEVHAAVSTVRESVGLPPALTSKGGSRSDFVRALMSTWPY